MKFIINSMDVFATFEKYLTQKNANNVVITFTQDSMILYKKAISALTKVSFPITIIEKDPEEDISQYCISFPAESFFSLLSLLANNKTLEVRRNNGLTGLLIFSDANSRIDLSFSFLSDLSFVTSFEEQIKNNNYIEKFTTQNKEEKEKLLEIYLMLEKAGGLFGKSILDMCTIYPSSIILSNEKCIAKKSLLICNSTLFIPPTLLTTFKSLLNLEHPSFSLSILPDSKILIEDTNFITIIALPTEATVPTEEMVAELESGQEEIFSLSGEELLSTLTFINSFYSNAVKNKILYVAINKEEQYVKLSLKDSFSVFVEKKLTNVSVLSTEEFVVDFTYLLFIAKNAHNTTLKVSKKMNSGTKVFNVTVENDQTTNYLLNYMETV